MTRDMTEDSSKRSEGITPSERYLAKLCNRSFLRLWSYSGVSRDQAIGSGNPQGKEICDLLVLFGDHVIIFSDKDCAFPNNVNVQVAWRRWASKAIFASAKQLYGAERWFKERPDRLFTDLSCRTPLPLRLPLSDRAIFHRIVVAHGALDACRSYFGGGRGSLVLNSKLSGEAEHYQNPFQVGHVNRAKGFVHVLDEANLALVLQNLDTIADFTAYLTRKEALLSGSVSVTAAGEEELLATYLTKLNKSNEHDFVVPEQVTAVAYDEGHWSSYENHKQKRWQVEANKVSYIWDEIIEKFTHHTLTGTHRTTTQTSIAEQELLYRWLARESRTRRRILAKGLMGLVVGTPPDTKATRIIVPSFPEDPYYIFLVLPRHPQVSDEEYREVRENLLAAYCTVLKLKFSDAEDIVGLATESGFSPENRSEDLLYYDARDWSRAEQEEARRIQLKFDLLTHVAEWRGREDEYPREERIGPELRGPLTISRNKKCPCKSGKRYGKCHGKEHYRKSPNHG